MTSSSYTCQHCTVSKCSFLVREWWGTSSLSAVLVTVTELQFLTIPTLWISTQLNGIWSKIETWLTVYVSRLSVFLRILIELFFCKRLIYQGLSTLIFIASVLIFLKNRDVLDHICRVMGIYIYLIVSGCILLFEIEIEITSRYRK